jgi:iron complex outermembrane receptor protein
MRKEGKQFLFKRKIFKRTAILTFIQLCLFFVGFTQTGSLIEISGQVTDQEKKLPLSDVNVQIKGTASGTVTNSKGVFVIRTKTKLPLTLVFSYVGFQQQEVEVKSLGFGMLIALAPKEVLGDEVVVTASRVVEKILKAPVTIEKLDVKSIKESPSPAFFDALENVKGVQMTTVSIGYKVPNTRGFNSTTNTRFLQLVDGTDVVAPAIGASIANTVGPTELDVESVELIPGAGAAVYGMNAINGIANIRTKNPFNSQGLGIYQRTGINHIDGKGHNPSLFTESAIRYAKAFNDKFAFKVNFGYTRGYDWVANDTTDVNALINESTGLLGYDNPGKDPVNSYGNESGNRKSVTLNGKKYIVTRTGYHENEFIDYRIQNLKADAGLFYKLNGNTTLSYTYRVGTIDNMYHRGNRIKLDDYRIQQHVLDFKGSNYFLKFYYTDENSGKSYNARPAGESLDRYFKSDAAWFNQYESRYLYAANTLGYSVADAHRAARAFADSGRLAPNSPELKAELKKITANNNWDNLGAALILKSKYYNLEGQYEIQKIKFLQILLGFNARTYSLYPDGNSFINPAKAGANLHYSQGGGFVQLSKNLLKDKLKLLASGRIDNVQYYGTKFNARFGTVYTLGENNNFRFTYQNGYRFPTLLETFSYLDNGGVRRLGGIPLMSQSQQIFENSYLKSSTDAFQKAVNNDINVNGYTQSQAIEKNKRLLQKSDYTYIKPEQINSFEFGYKTLLFNNKIYVDFDFYFNIYKNFIGQLDINQPNNGIIGIDDSTVYYAYDQTKYTRYRMWTNSKSITHNQGSGLAITYNFYKKFTIGSNVSYAELKGVSEQDALVPAFNTPKWIVNLSFGNKEVFKNFGFNIVWKWQSSFLWQNPLADGIVPSYNTFDAQVNYRFPKLFSTIKLGATNLLNRRYYQFIGGPVVGGLYYTTITVDGLLNK